MLLKTYGSSESNVEVTLQLQHEASNDTEEVEMDRVDDETDAEVNEDGIPQVSEDSTRMSTSIAPNQPIKTTCDSGGSRRPLFSCNRCERLYTKKHSVLRHLRYECGVAPQFQCSICPQRFKHRSDQQRHERKIHGVEGVEGVFDVDDASSWFLRFAVQSNQLNPFVQFNYYDDGPLLY